MQTEIENQVEEVKEVKQLTSTKSKERKKLNLQRKTDKYVVWARELSSRGSSFWIAILGVILQAAHTSLLLYGTSAFTSEWQKIVVSLGMGLFLSSALMIFTLKHIPGDRRSEFTLNLFFYFEIFIGVFYYLNKLIFSVHKETGAWPGLDNYIYLLIGLPFAYMAPYAIKQFAYVIKSDTSREYGDIDVVPYEEEQQVDDSLIDQLKDELRAELLEELSSSIETTSTMTDELLQSIDERIDKAILLNNDNNDSTDISQQFETLKNTTKKLLKDFKADMIDQQKSFIKKGSTITLKTANGVNEVVID